MAIGSLIGGGIGAVVGGVATEGAGTAAGYAIGSGVGSLVEAGIKKSQANKVDVPLQDIRTAALLDEIQRKRKQIEAGGGAGYTLGKGLINKSLAQTQSNIIRGAGGDARSVLTGLTRAQSTAGQLTNKLIAQQEDEYGRYIGLASNIIKQLAERRLALKEAEKLQKLRESAELTTTGFKDLQSGLAEAFPTEDNGGNTKITGTNETTMAKPTFGYDIKPNGISEYTDPNYDIMSSYYNQGISPALSLNY